MDSVSDIAFVAASTAHVALEDNNSHGTIGATLIGFHRHRTRQHDLSARMPPAGGNLAATDSHPVGLRDCDCVIEREQRPCVNAASMRDLRGHGWSRSKAGRWYRCRHGARSVDGSRMSPLRCSSNEITSTATIALRSTALPAFGSTRNTRHSREQRHRSINFPPSVDRLTDPKRGENQVKTRNICRYKDERQRIYEREWGPERTDPKPLVLGYTYLHNLATDGPRWCTAILFMRLTAPGRDSSDSQNPGTKRRVVPQ